MDEFFLFLCTVMGVPMFFYFIGSYLRLKLNILKRTHQLDQGDSIDSNIQQQMNYLMAENEEIKEELRNIKYLLGQNIQRERIDLNDYEKEQMRLDKDAKDSFSI